MRKRLLLSTLMILSVLCSTHAQDTPNARQARRIFNQAYKQVFGEEGATLQYDVNIIGLYKTKGTIWYKGKKNKFVDSKIMSWNDGNTVYIFKKKKKEIEIHSASNNKSDKYSRKFKFEPDNFDYGITEDPQGLKLILNAKKGVKGIKEAHVLVERGTYNPISLRIKIAFFWTTIKISNFKSGGITDEMLAFPEDTYKHYKFVDKR